MTDGILEPDLLDYTTSEHDYILKPSDASSLELSDVVFYVDDNLETFVKTFSKDNKRLVQLSKTIDLLPTRPHSFSKKVANVHGKKDLHIWLSPENAKSMILLISKTLSDLDQENSYRYNANAVKAVEKIDQEVKKIAQDLNNFRNQKYIVTHDAYQYFEKYFGLNSPSVILSIEEDSYLGMRTLMELRKVMKKENIKCILSHSREDSIKPQILSSDTRTTILDPIGAEIESGESAYLAIMNDIAQGFKSCFAAPTRD